MAVSLGSNISSLQALRSLGGSIALGARASERLASGVRISRASDDPAGLAVSVALSTRARVLGRAELNVRDGESALAIVDGATGQVSSILTRLTELATQASNGTFGSSQRAALSREYRQLNDEIRRIAATTRFNGLQLLSGATSSNTATTIEAPDVGDDRALGVSGDGRYSIYSSGDGVSNYNVFLYDRTTQSSTQLTSSGGGAAAISSSGDVVYQDGNNLFLYDVAAGTSRQLTHATGNENYNLAFSADGSTVAFTSLTTYQDGGTLDVGGAQGTSKVYTVNLDSGRVSALSYSGSFNGLIISSDGSKVAYTQFISNRIYAANVGGGAKSFSQLTSNGGGSGSTAIANDGTVYFITNANVSGQNPSGTTQLLSVTLQGQLSRLSNFTSNFVTSGNLTLSADEGSLYFVGGSRAQRLDLGIGLLTELGGGGGISTNFQFSRDGQVVLGETTGVSFNGVSIVELTPNQLGLDISVGTGTLGGIRTNYDQLIGNLQGFGGYAITSAKSARLALDALQSNIATVSALRGTIGAGLARLQAAGSVLGVQKVETTGAESRIKDTDVASEGAISVRAQILQQVGAAILSQANQQPQLALQLLR